MLDNKNAVKYNADNANKKGLDQMFLNDHVFEYIKDRALIHDSYWCAGITAKPWPTQRLGDCFVGSNRNCNETATINRDIKDCPVACRPPNHLDWSKC